MAYTSTTRSPACPFAHPLFRPLPPPLHPVSLAPTPQGWCREGTFSCGFSAPAPAAGGWVARIRRARTGRAELSREWQGIWVTSKDKTDMDATAAREGGDQGGSAVTLRVGGLRGGGLGGGGGIRRTVGPVPTSTRVFRAVRVRYPGVVGCTARGSRRNSAIERVYTSGSRHRHLAPAACTTGNSVQWGGRCCTTRTPTRPPASCPPCPPTAYACMCTDTPAGTTPGAPRGYGCRLGGSTGVGPGAAQGP